MSDLITVTMDGEALEVHPTCLAAHEALGWVKADPLDHDGDGKKGGSKGRKAEAPAEPETPASEPEIDAGEEETGEPPLTRTEIEADLTAMVVDFDPSAPLADLRAERDAARAKRTAKEG